MAKLMSLDYAPFDLAYADFDADRYLKSLTMPVLVNYGTYDTAMPIEQGAQRIIATANKSGNENVTVRYFAGNHQMRAGEGLFTPNLPLAEGYTQALENWVNGVTAGTKADGWATPQVAGATPHQRFARVATYQIRYRRLAWRAGRSDGGRARADRDGGDIRYWLDCVFLATDVAGRAT